MKILVQFSYFS